MLTCKKKGDSMDFYMCLIILTELLMIAMILHVARYSGFTKEQKIWYILTFTCVMFCSAAEYAVHCGYYHKSFAIPLTILTVLQFSIAPVLAMLFSGALGLKYQKHIAVGFFAINFITQVISAPFRWIFYFGDKYTRGPAFTVYVVFYIISLVYLLVCLVIVGRKFRARDLPTIIMVLVIIIAGIIPMMTVGLNVTYMAIGIGASLCYIYYNDLVQQDIKREVIEKQQRISSMQEHIISGLANLIEDRDMETGDHIIRTRLYAKMLAEFCRQDGVYADVLTDHFIKMLYNTAPMHDLGKVVVSDKVLRKPGKLTPEEYEEMKKHAAVGGDVVREVLNGITDSEYLNFAADVATYHHEKWDGSGYPKGLKGEEIPLPARFMAIADVYDALISPRVYKGPLTPEEAFMIIEKESGTHFDPKIAGVFINHKEAFLPENLQDKFL